MQLKAIIVEDEPLSRIFLQNLLKEYFPQIELLQAVADEDGAVAAINNHQPDLVFLDIELQTGTGFEVLKRITGKFPLIIFITAYDHYSIKPIRFSGIEYLLKPVDVEELQQAIHNTCQRKHQPGLQTAMGHLMQTIQHNNHPTWLSLPTAENFDFVLIDAITRIENVAGASRFVLKSGEEKIAGKNIHEYEELLEEHRFLRIHQDHLINMKEIRKNTNAGSGFITMNDNSMIPISPKKLSLYQSLAH